MGNITSEITKETVALMKGTLGTPLDPGLLRGSSLTKGVSIATGLTWYNLPH